MDTETTCLIAKKSEKSHSQKPPWIKKVKHHRISCCNSTLIEVVVVLYFTYYSGSVPLVQQFLYTKVAQTLNYTGPLPGDKAANRETCEHPNISDPNYILEQRVQEESASWLLYTSAAYLGTALFVTIFLGGYSDRAGRKIAIIVPLIGSLAKIGLYIAIVALELDLWLLVLGSVFEGLLGGAAVLVMGCFSYMADISTAQSRSIKIIILEVCLSIGTILSNLGLGTLIQYVGYLWPFVILAGMIFINLLFVIFAIKETVKAHDSVPFFTLDHINRTYLVFTKQDESRRRMKLCLSLLFTALISMVSYGKNNLMLLWLLKSPLCWNSLLVGYYIAYMFLVYGIGGISATKIVQPRLGDLNLATISCISFAASTIVFSFAHQNWLVWLAPIVGFLSGIAIGLVRAYMSKVVQPHEMGAMFGCVAIVELLGALIGQVAFTAIYGVTLSPAWLSGLSFWIMALSLFFTASITMVLQRYSRPSGLDVIRTVSASEPD